MKSNLPFRIVYWFVVLCCLVAYWVPTAEGREWNYWIGYTMHHREINKPCGANCYKEGNDAIWVFPITINVKKKTVAQCLKDGGYRFNLSNGTACSIGSYKDGKFFDTPPKMKNLKKWIAIANKPVKP